MNIGAVGYNYEHRERFFMERPDGTGCCLLLLIKEPSIFEINGVEQRVPKNSFVIFSPKTPYRYRADGDVYTDDWMYFNLEQGDKQRLAELEIPFDTVVPIMNMDELTQLMRVIAFEFYTEDKYNQRILNNYVGILMLKLSRDISMMSLLRSQSHSEKHYTLFHLRNTIYATPENLPTIDEMAKQTGMSRSGFQHLYKKVFGVSVMSDVIDSRLARAKRLLRSTGLSIKDISAKCGYASEYSFMRQFKAKVGSTPTEYRNRV